MKTRYIILAAGFLAVCAAANIGCSCGTDRGDVRVVPVPSVSIAVSGSGADVVMGGYGSSMCYNEADSCFWLLTDRGPNVDGPVPESKVFACEGFVPRVGRFRLDGGKLVKVGDILITDVDGNPFSGLPVYEGDGGTGEIGYDIRSEVICDTLHRGIDTEGLALVGDGTFWVSDEYGPYVMHFDADGRLIEEYTPFNGGLPRILALRRPNRGMEGLTYSAENNTLYGIMQSPLYNPDSSTGDVSSLCRIIGIDLENGVTTQYLYRLENPRNVVSDIMAMNDGRFLMLERDGAFPKGGEGFKRVYLTDLTDATEISQLDTEGVVPEMLSDEDLAGMQVQTATKELYCDILESAPGYPHDKPEGMCIAEGRLCIVNDDDFGIASHKISDGRVVEKTIPGTDRRDACEIYMIDTASLR